MESFTEEEVLEWGPEGKYDLSQCVRWEQVTYRGTREVSMYLKTLKRGKHIHSVYLQLDAQTPPFRFQTD